jgi:phosphoglycolate phosphatase
VRPSEPVFHHVAFDLDGTLIDSRADLAAAVNHALRVLGLPAVDADTVYGYVGEGARVLVERALGPAHRDRVEEGLALFMAHYGAHLLDHTRPFPGIEEMSAVLGERGVVLSVLTNKPAALSRTILDGLGLLPRFLAVLGGDSLPTRKPDPAGVEHLRALTGTPRDRMLLVGDSGIDVRTARAAGVGFCGVSWGLVPDGLRAAAPERIVAHPSELLPIVLGGR